MDNISQLFLWISFCLLTLGVCSPLQDAGLLVGDIITSVDATDCKWGDHPFVVSLIRNTDTSVILTVVTPSSLKDITELYNVKLAREDQVVTSDYSDSNGSQSSGSSRNSTLNGVYSQTSSSSSGSARSGTAVRHSSVLEMGNESILWQYELKSICYQCQCSSQLRS